MIPDAGWLVEQITAPAAELHQPWPAPDDRSRRIFRRCHVAGPGALVLGSSFPLHHVDHQAVTAAHMEVVRRRSGGGAVVVAPGAQLWFDAWVPRRDPLWRDDVVVGSFWLGETWAGALRDQAVDHVSVHRARAVVTEWSSLVCFAGVGPGEVSAGRRKVVGLSQRRNSEGILLHSMALLRWDPDAVADLLALTPEQRRRAHRESGPAAAGLADLSPVPAGGGPLEALARSVLDHLPQH